MSHVNSVVNKLVEFVILFSYLLVKVDGFRWVFGFPTIVCTLVMQRASWLPKREECAVCNRAVYAMERLEADKIVYHKTCFKCSVCNKTLRCGEYCCCV